MHCTYIHAKQLRYTHLIFVLLVPSSSPIPLALNWGMPADIIDNYNDAVSSVQLNINEMLAPHGPGRNHKNGLNSTLHLKHTNIFLVCAQIFVVHLGLLSLMYYKNPVLPDKKY